MMKAVKIAIVAVLLGLLLVVPSVAEPAGIMQQDKQKGKERPVERDKKDDRREERRDDRREEKKDDKKKKPDWNG
jgi:hypothetical protein